MYTNEALKAARDAAVRNITGAFQEFTARIDIRGQPWDVHILSVNQFVGWVRVHNGVAVWRSGDLVTGRAETGPIVAGGMSTGFAVLSELVEDWYLEVAPQNDAIRYPGLDTIAGFVGAIENHSPLPAAHPYQAEPSVASNHTTPDFNPYFHTTERHPPASGFTEADLNGVPLVTVHPAAIPAAVSGFLLLVAILGAPYPFYEVVRWGVTAMAVWAAIVAGNQKRTAWTVAFSAAAVLFNPFIPVYLTREAWVPLDAAVLVLFISAGVKLRASRPATSKDGPARITG
ncbi:DUF6804 family protein [Arthrobacter sp. MPF02]|uniref:DUF6804 family protein n=1 Tax=Arthrobacter sp. MPF02 TaxID=3388492 RepID=UPI00398483A4